MVLLLLSLALAKKPAPAPTPTPQPTPVATVAPAAEPQPQPMGMLDKMEAIGGLVTCFGISGALVGIFLQSRAESKRRLELLAKLPDDIRPTAQQTWSTPILDAYASGALTLDQVQAVRERRLPMGMPPAGVRLVWGQPHDVDREGGRGGDVEIWTWWERGRRGGKKIDKRVIFRNGKLEKWQDK